MPPRLVLASRSPRRKQLLEMTGWPFDVQESQADETIAPGTPPEEAVQMLARRKVEAVMPSIPDAYILGADTMVVYGDRFLGKPHTAEEAFDILRLLSGRTHDVWTGVAIATPNGEVVSFAEKTAVTFWELSEEEIAAYIATGEPMDKAGAYGIQGQAALFVKRIEGDYFNVVGLPLSRTVRELRRFGWPSSGA
ncbi:MULTISPECIES: Maf family protein [Geobacillus]|jgi:septum formation protein|uniref:dTTP/UTP pyrophosphatase n=2 Tax=Geobacillus thermodenitrificans TaxID=33940 RepID=A4IRE0_GEOTN|nr:MULTISPECIES: Maf family protein [Geobacillus]ABO67894.1 Septum formation protein MaF [Geobacillus thermodenitrificans NG80-2]ARA98933.1 septum formation inhibitor Maf [Geobacillus thermodenitrificans]ARP43644.1 Septum formation protein Maf [Geobacillus thermodenitrificans]ATO38300.1 septum formation inhibitor Maf [Geobacillus thermodenitrificans]KQB92462.1 Septum formation protein Maf [Geobacillus sp. PA-3]